MHDRFATSAPRLPHPAKERGCIKSHLFVCFRFHQKPKAVQTVKLTLDHRVTPTSAIYRDLIHRMNQSRPHISSDIINVKERERQKPDQCALSSGAPAFPCLSMFRPHRLQPRLVSSPPPLRPASRQRLSAAGEGLSTDYTRHPQAPFPIIRHLFFIREKMVMISEG